MPKTPTIAIDGPAGAGKSTVAKAVAKRLGYTLVDTGAIYRSVALAAHEATIAWEDGPALAQLIAGMTITFQFEDGNNRVLVNGRDVSAHIRTPLISDGASRVSQLAPVRAGLLELQRQLAGQGGAVLEGRDIGTVVCPDAEVKIFLVADPTERAKRRFDELRERGESPDLEEILQNVIERDNRDSNRAVSPLKPAPDAHRLDCTSMTAAEVVDAICQRAEEYLR